MDDELIGAGIVDAVLVLLLDALDEDVEASITFEGMRQRNLRSHLRFVSERLSEEADRSHVRT